MTVFPHSPVIDSVPDEGLLKEWADEALNAFFKVIVDKLDDVYPGSRTYGDVGPFEALERERIALKWVRSFATNNTAVQAASEEV